MFWEFSILCVLMLEFNKGDFQITDSPSDQSDNFLLNVTVATFEDEDNTVVSDRNLNGTSLKVEPPQNLNETQVYDQKEAMNLTLNNEKSMNSNSSTHNNSLTNAAEISYRAWLQLEKEVNHHIYQTVTTSERVDLDKDPFTQDNGMQHNLLKDNQLSKTTISPVDDTVTGEKRILESTVSPNENSYYFYNDDNNFNEDNAIDYRDDNFDEYLDYNNTDDYNYGTYYDDNEPKRDNEIYGKDELQWTAIHDLDHNSELRSRVPDANFAQHPVLPFKSISGVKVSHVGERVEVHWPVHLADPDANLSVIVLYTWLAIVAVIILGSFLIVKHRQRLTSLFAIGKRRQRSEDEDHNLLLHQHV